MRIAALVAVVALLVPSRPAAQEGEGRASYLEAHLGAWFPQDDDLDAIDTGFDLGATLGARFSRHLAVEGELSWTRATGYAGPAFLTLNTLPITASVRVILPARRAELHALTGAGVHMAGISGEWSSAGSAAGATRWQATLGWHLGAGGSVRLSRAVTLGAEVRRTFANASFDAFDLRIDGLRVAATFSYEL
jgi:opacity protein-like surface antigen